MSAELSKIVADGFEILAAEAEHTRKELRSIGLRLDRLLELHGDEAENVEQRFTRQSERIRALEKPQQ